VVGLLERKHAWSDADLERYMSLIRSEHSNEQAVQGAKENVVAAERALEEARTRLEKRERMQYHEEQIWSDTIRRNSTWVTFGLMGVNIFLLLGTLVLIEPWRRKRMVKEIRKALEEKNAVPVTLAVAAAPAMQTIEKEIDEVVEPEITLDSVQDAPLDHSSQTTAPITSVQIEAKADEDTPILSISDVVDEPPFESPPQPTPSVLEGWKFYVQELFSKQTVTVRKVDVTTIALEGLVIGATLVGLLVALLRPGR